MVHDSSATSRYIHGTDPDEQARLSGLNDLLNASCVRELAPRIGERILDVGAGLGQLSRDMARLAQRPVVAIERSVEQIDQAHALARQVQEEGLVEFRRGDVLSFPLKATEWGTFDVAHARFILEHVATPKLVVAQMIRAVRPGGRIVLCDDDHSLLRLHPEPPRLRTIWAAFAGTYERSGNDPYIGKRLVQLLSEAGARPQRFTWIFVGACAAEPRFAAFVANLIGNLRGARDAIAETGAVAARNVDAMLAELDDFARRPDASIGYAFPWAEAIRDR